MDTFTKILIVIGSLAMAIGLICWCLGIFNDSKSTGNESMNQMHTVSKDFQESDKTAYDGLPVSGNQVMHVITKYGDDLDSSFKITVKTLANTAGTVYSTKTSTFPAKSSDDFINPAGNFLGSVTYNSNKAVSGIVFTQQK